MQQLKGIHLTIEKDWCKGCGLCIEACPNNLLTLSEDLNASGFHYAVFTNLEECTGCASCALMCPDLAIEIRVLE